MKRTMIALAMIMVISATVFANPFKVTKGSPKFASAEANLIKGLQTDNYGVMYFSAHMLGEMKSEAAVNELMRILRNDKYDESLRIVAALSLTKIGTEQSTYMVGQQVKFNDSEKIARLCEKFYNAHVNGRTTDESRPVQFAKN